MSFDFETFETSADDIDSPIFPVPPVPPPPLRIHHFLLCGIVTAVYLMWWQQMVPPSVMQQFPPVALGANAVYNVLTAIAFTLAAISVCWYIKGDADLSQPGVWLLLSYLIYMLPALLNNTIGILTGFDWSLALRGFNGPLEYWLATVWCFTLYSFLPFAFFAYCAWAIADTRPWRWVFVSILILQVLPSVGLVHRLFMVLGVPMQTAYAILPIFINAIVIVSVESWAAKTDLAGQRERYWPHWAGLWLAIAKQSLIALGAIVTLLGWF